MTAVPERYYDAWNRLHGDVRPTSQKWKAGLNALRQIVMEAQSNGKSVRAVGGTWSLSDAAVSQDYMINTKPLNFLEIGLKPASVDPGCRLDPKHLVFAQCGVRVATLNQRLERRLLSLPTSGASNGQTICGAVATGTHGSAVKVGAMQDYVLGLHIIGDRGNHYWVERDSRRVVSQTFCDILGAKLIHDDRLFNAAVVGSGSFGVIHAMLLRTEPIYLLEVHRKRYDYNEVKALIGTLDVSSLNLPGGDVLPFHFEVMINPYATKNGERGAMVRSMYKRTYDPSLLPQDRDRGNRHARVRYSPGEGVLSLIGTLTDAEPSLIPSVVTGFVNSLFPDMSNHIGTHGNIFGGTNIRGKSLSTEIGVNLSRAPEAVDALLDVAKNHPFPGVIALRFVRKSSALLAFTRFRTTCTIELPAANSVRSHAYYEAAWDELEKRGIRYTLHWGQANNFTGGRVRNMWGAAVDDWLEARREFLPRHARRTFSNRLLRLCELAD